MYSGQRSNQVFEVLILEKSRFEVDWLDWALEVVDAELQVDLFVALQRTVLEPQTKGLLWQCSWAGPVRCHCVRLHLACVCGIHAG